MERIEVSQDFSGFLKPLITHLVGLPLVQGFLSVVRKFTVCNPDCTWCQHPGRAQGSEGSIWDPRFL